MGLTQFVIIAIDMVFISLFLPILIGIGASNDPYTDWTDGFFVHLGSEIAGPWLGVWMMLAATVTNVGMFEAEMSSDAWQIAGMAEKGRFHMFVDRCVCYVRNEK
jgi:hypothetical protein